MIYVLLFVTGVFCGVSIGFIAGTLFGAALWRSAWNGYGDSVDYTVTMESAKTEEQEESDWWKKGASDRNERD
jgi:hypothetical protein